MRIKNSGAMWQIQEQAVKYCEVRVLHFWGGAPGVDITFQGRYESTWAGDDS